MNLHLNTRLLTLEEKYTLVTELVMIKDVQLKNTVHDLRQSLRALRFAPDVAQGAGRRSGPLDNLRTDRVRWLSNRAIRP